MLPQITIGMLITSPIATRRKLPCAAPATASTLSRPITVSAMTTVRSAPQKLVAALAVVVPALALLRDQQLVGDPDKQ